MNNLIPLLNSIAQEWQTLYSVGSVLPMTFYEKDDLLFFNGKALFPLQDLTITSSTIEIDFISISFENFELIIHIIWPEERDPYIGYIGFNPL